jgi:polyisoprenoid-binding protein YceI
MVLRAMTYGPDNASLRVHTYREGVAAKVGHDLVIEVGRWDATLDDAAVELNADARSLRVLEGRRGVKPLSDKDRAEILKTIDERVLHSRPIAFRSSTVRRDGGHLEADGELTLDGTTRPLTVRVEVDADGRVNGTVPVTQSDWGIKPYRGLMGALKVRDDVEVVFASR